MKVAVFLISCMSAVGASASTLFLSSAYLYRADLDSHQYVPIGDQSSRLPFYGELASDWRQGSFRLWNVNDNRLYEVSPVTGAVVKTTRIIYSGTADGMRTLAFDVTSGRLYGTGGFALAGGTQGLYRIDADTGAADLVGTIKSSTQAGTQTDLYGLAFDGQGNLWATADEYASGSSGQSNYLLKINTSTMAVSSRIRLQEAFDRGAVTDIAFRPEDNQLFGIGYSGSGVLFNIDPVTGAETTISMGNNVGGGGLAFGPVPEPSLLWVVGLAFLRPRRRFKLSLAEGD